MSVEDESKERKIADFEVKIPAKDLDSGEIIGMTNVVGNRNEYIVQTRYGFDGGKISIMVFDYDEDAIKSLSAGDPIWIRSYGEIPIKARVLNTVFSPQRVNGEMAHFRINAIPESVWTMRNKIIFSKKFGKPIGIFELVREMVKAAFSINPDLAPTVENLASESGIYNYDSVVNDGSRCIGEIIDDLVAQNDMEWYCDPFSGSITLGYKCPARPYFIDDMMEILNNKVKYFSYGGRLFMSFILEGSPSFIVGSSLVYKGVTWKIIKGIYGENGRGLKESIGICIKNNHTATRALMEAIDIKHGDWIETPKIMLGDASISDEEIGDAWREKTRVLFNVDKKTKTLDPQEIEFYEGQQIENVIWSSPFAGNGIGMRFPVYDKQRNMVFSTDRLQGFSMIGNSIWKKDDVVPECEPKDFYLRMEKGSLYFDEQEETWLVKSNSVKLEADDPDDAESKPDPTTATGMWLELDKDSHITIHVDDSNYIEVASDGKIRINASSEVTVEGPAINLGAAASLKNARVTDIVDTTVLSPWWTAVVAATTAGGGPTLAGWAAFYAYIVATGMPSNVGVIKSNTSKVKSE